MINTILSNAWSIFALALSLVVLCLIPTMLELWRAVRDIRIVAGRIEMITDVSRWGGMLKKLRLPGCCKGN